eukprot:3929927-Pyramimonas_sp.AAC.1
MVAAWTSLGLAPRLGATPRGESGSKIITNRLKAMRKSSADALDNLNKADQRQRKWVSNSQIRLRAGLAGSSFVNSQPGAVFFLET